MNTMVKRVAHRCLVAGLTTFGACGGALGLETVVSDDFCRVEGLSRPLRQTIVVLDQNVIKSASGIDIGATNRQWLNNILTIAGVQEGQATLISAPRERLTVLIAREDGGELIRVFTGCSPTYSQDETGKMQESEAGMKGTIDWFLGRNLQTRIENQQRAFRTKLTSALSELPSTASSKLSAGQARNTVPTFLQAFSLFAGTIDLGQGIPRVFVVSAMNAPALRALPDAKAARQLGFELADNVGGDLQRAEIYLNGVAPDSGKYVREFSHAFFLGIKGKLSGALSGETLPAVTAAPKAVHVFGGFIEYGRVNVPIQIRLVPDQGGSLVNSWVEVTIKRAVATPLTGKLVCVGDENCKVTGDGKEFAQSWVVDPSADMMKNFDESIPFSGLRYFEFEISAESAKGRVYDPLVTSISGKKDLSFELSRTSNIKF